MENLLINCKYNTYLIMLKIWKNELMMCKIFYFYAKKMWKSIATMFWIKGILKKFEALFTI